MSNDDYKIRQLETNVRNLQDAVTRLCKALEQTSEIPSHVQNEAGRARRTL
jgi:outer membrane murein-binding lipoprotein Lpp